MNRGINNLNAVELQQLVLPLRERCRSSANFKILLNVTTKIHASSVYMFCRYLPNKKKQSSKLTEMQQNMQHKTLFYEVKLKLYIYVCVCVCLCAYICVCFSTYFELGKILKLIKEKF